MRCRLPFYCLLLAVLSCPARSEVVPLAHWAEGPATSLARENDMVYLARGGRLEFLDVTDPADPELLGWYEVGEFIVQVQVEGGLACLRTLDRGIHILDVSDPLQVQPLALLALDGPVQDMELRGDRLYYTCSSQGDGFHILDIGDPAAPVELGVLVSDNLINFATYGDYAYISMSIGLLYVVDMRTPTAPTIVRVLPSFGGTYYSHTVCADGRLYVVVRNYFGLHSLRIYDIADPAVPVELGWTADSPVLFDCLADGGRFYGCSEDSVLVFDVSDPTAIRGIGGAPTLDRSQSIVSDGKIVYVAEESYGLQCFSAVEAGKAGGLEELGRYSEGVYGACTDVVVEGGLLYACYTAPGLVIYDPGQLAKPDIVSVLYDHVPGTVDTRGYTLAVHDRHVYLRCSDQDGSWLKVIDVTDPACPTEVAGIAGKLMNIQFNGSVGYVSQTSDGYFIQAYDFSDPAEPVLTASLPLTEVGQHAVDGDRLLVVLGDDFRAYDISDPSLITEIGHTDLAWASGIQLPLRMHCANGLATIVSSNGGWYADGLRTVDYADPNALLVHAAAGPGDAVWDIVAADAYMYMALGGSGVEIYSLADPVHPVLLDGYRTGSWAWGLSGDAHALFVADSYDGIVVLQSDPGPSGVAAPRILNPGMLGNHPNPFNPRTVITFTLKERREASLRILDARGRVVRNLAEGAFKAGDHEVVWDGRDDAGRVLPSGVYLSNLRTPDGTFMRKVVLAR